MTLNLARTTRETLPTLSSTASGLQRVEAAKGHPGLGVRPTAVDTLGGSLLGLSVSIPDSFFLSSPHEGMMDFAEMNSRRRDPDQRRGWWVVVIGKPVCLGDAPPQVSERQGHLSLHRSALQC